MKNLYKLISVLVIGVIISGVMTIMIPTQHDGVVTNIQESIVEWTDQELIDNSPYVIKGEIKDMKPVLYTKGDQSVVFTELIVNVDEVLKGEIHEDIIKVKVLGGQIDEHLTVASNNRDYHKADNLIIFLDKETEEDSFFGNEHYHIVTRANGVYEIVNGIAQHDDPRKTQPEKDLKEKIRSINPN